MGSLPIQAADQLIVEIEEMSIPITVSDLADWAEGMSIPSSIQELSDWANNEGKDYSEISSWFSLLDLESRAQIVKILKAPLIKDKSMARELIRSWAGRQLLDLVSDLIRLDNDKSGEKVFNTLETLLAVQTEVTTLDLLQQLPAENIYLDLDALLKVASYWRDELLSQQAFVLSLRKIPESPKNSKFTEFLIQEPENINNKILPEKKILKVDHRSESLSLEIWKPLPGSARKSSWIIFMTGLGGDQDHFRWLARSLSENGWPVVLLEHPGSDSKAVKELLTGKSPAPGAEVLLDRIKDLNSVLQAKENQTIQLAGEKVVLMGHSLGALTAFLSAGATPELGLDTRCEKALNDLSLTNLSKLLQCQIINVPLPNERKINNLAAIVAFNGFGSLLWPTSGGANISVPVFLAGGTYDLITPAKSEQISLLLSAKENLLSRIMLIEGASHFSLIRVEGQLNQHNGDDLFQLGEAIVGFQPIEVQNLLRIQTLRFLAGLENGIGMQEISNKNDNYLRYYLVDRKTVEKFLID